MMGDMGSADLNPRLSWRQFAALVAAIACITAVLFLGGFTFGFKAGQHAALKQCLDD